MVLNNINGVSLWENKLQCNTKDLLNVLIQNVKWDESIKARKTASFGKSYNYSGIEYSELEMLPQLEEMCDLIEMNVGWKPNNCLLNYYEDGQNVMGWHSDRTDII
jgi:alkylated DNA repair dioxygenase AlkB